MLWLSLDFVAPSQVIATRRSHRQVGHYPTTAVTHCDSGHRVRRALVTCVLLGLMVPLVSGSLPETARAATLTVTNLADAGAGSLRQCMLDANGLAGPDIIEFDAGVTGTIHLTAALPLLQSPDGDGTEIRGETADDVLAGPDILLDTSGAGGAGILIEANSCVVRGLEIENANIAVDILGTMASPAQLNTIGGIGAREQNVLRNGGIGVRLLGEGVTNNTVVNNHVFSNSGNGIELLVGASFNVIQGNVVFENGANGILLLADQGFPMHDNELIGNIVGLDATGLAVLANVGDGIRLEAFIDNLHDNLLGQNLVSGNMQNGVTIVGPLAFDNTASENRIGVDATGTVALANQQHGVHLLDGAKANVIGPDNLISGNAWDGVMIDGSGTDANRIEDSTIGLDASGTAGLGNGRNGVHIAGGAQDDEVASCLIGANTHNGVMIFGAGTEFHKVHNNFIGTDVTGSAPLPNGGMNQGGVYVWESAKNCDIGPNNVVSAHSQPTQFGIKLMDKGTQGHQVFDNIVGLTADQTADLPNYDGIVNESAGMNVIGPNNVVSGNSRWGVFVQDALNVVVKGNTIGTDVTENTVFPNQSGIYLETGNCSVGGDPAAGESNVICGNATWGIEAHSSLGIFGNNNILGNWIGENTNGTAVPNGDGGIWIGDSIEESLIGHPMATSLGNKILHNGPASVSFGQGVLVGEAGAVSQPVGIRILRNSISDNGAAGIELVGGANNSITPPVVLNATTFNASGTSGLAGTISTVQVFQDTADEGLTFVGQTLTDAAGNWNLAIAPPLVASGNLTATNTADWMPGTTIHTSEFALPVKVDAVSDTGDEPVIPQVFSVRLSSANPSRGSARVALAAPHAARVVARVYDARGKLVREVANDDLPAGMHQIVWDGATTTGLPAPSGRYFFDVRYNTQHIVRRVTLLR